MSYFKLIPSKSAKAYKNLTKNLNISDQFKKINDLYQDFLTFYNKKYKFVKEYGFKNLKTDLFFKHNNSKISRRCFYLHKKKFYNMCDYYLFTHLEI